MKRFIFALIVLALFVNALAQSPADDLFVGMQPLEGVAYEKHSDPTDLMSDLILLGADDVEPDGIGYRYYISQGSEPSILYEDVCPAGYETVWYTLEAYGVDPVTISFRSEINELVNGEVDWENLDNLFAPVFREAQRVNSGQEIFTSPVYIGSCSYSETRGDFYRYHEATVDSTGMDTVRCQILVNNSGKQTVISESEAPYAAQCYGEQ
jgi:hypothetical protein